MGRIYLPPTEPADAEAAEVAESAAPAGGRIYVTSPEPVVDDATVAVDDESPADQDEDKTPETVTVTEPAETEPAPPPPKKATAQRGKASQ